MQLHDSKTRPLSPRATLTQAISLAKSGQKAEACGLFRQILALQPVNQAAWLWLSAITPDQAEAVAALNQARQINPAHPSLLQAEQWFVHRFSPAPDTRKMTPVQIDDKSSEQNSPHPTLSLRERVRGVSNSLIFGLVVLSILFGLCVLFLGLLSQFRATTLARKLLYQETSSFLPIEELPGFAYNSFRGNLTGLGRCYGIISLEPQTLALDSCFGEDPAVVEKETGDDPPLDLDRAWIKQDWARAIAILENLHQLKPESQPIKEQLSQAHVQMGVALRSRGFVEEALIHFERALQITPGQTEANQEQQLASTYLTAVSAYQAGRWPEALADFETIWGKTKDYPNIRDLLYSAYYNQALALEAAKALPEAQAALKEAIALHPELSAPRRLMAEIEFALAPQTPLDKTISMVPLKDRMVIVGIAEQRMVVYEGKRVVFEFVVSTGEPGRDTAIGEFEILDKIDVAYASTWNLDMPYWMGIYWAGPLQNGIHALPIVKHTGYKLWDGYLGQRVSYGCVILSDEDAATLYDWAVVGAKVKIVPSLSRWLAERTTN